MAIRTRNLFPTTIAEGRVAGHAALNRRLLADIATFSRQDKMGRDWSAENYRGGYSSYASLNDMHRRSPVFSRFEELMAPHAEAFARAQGWERRGLELVMTDCWMNVMGKFSYHALHFHPHSAISGTYYVAIPPRSAGLKIEDPRMAFYMNAPLRRGPRGALYHTVSPKPGSFVLFESWLRHEVPPNHASGPRVSLSFNYALERP